MFNRFRKNVDEDDQRDVPGQKTSVLFSDVGRHPGGRDGGKPGFVAIEKRNKTTTTTTKVQSSLIIFEICVFFFLLIESVPTLGLGPLLMLCIVKS